jgi:hypothetical protein
MSNVRKNPLLTRATRLSKTAIYLMQRSGIKRDRDAVEINLAFASQKGRRESLRVLNRTESKVQTGSAALGFVF